MVLALFRGEASYEAPALWMLKLRGRALCFSVFFGFMVVVSMGFSMCVFRILRGLCCRVSLRRFLFILGVSATVFLGLLLPVQAVKP